MWTQATMKPVKGPENVYLPPIRYAGSHGLRKALWLAGQVPDWPADELPQAFHGFHEDWGGESGYGEFRRVEGFSMYVDRNDAEICVISLIWRCSDMFGS
jgi:hypothetical protein